MDFFAAMARRLHASVEEVAAAHDGWIEGEMEGAASLLVDLKAAGHTTACLSNTCACHWDEMQRWPIFRHIDFPHASHLLGAFKPDGKIYELLPGQFRAPRGTSCSLMIGGPTSKLRLRWGGRPCTCRWGRLPSRAFVRCSAHRGCSDHHPRRSAWACPEFRRPPRWQTCPEGE